MTSNSETAIDRAGERRLVGLLATTYALLIAGGIAIPVLTSANANPATLALGDVSEAQIVEIRDAGGRPILSGEFRATVDAVGNTEKDAALIDGRGRAVIGEVELEIPAPSRKNRRTELEVDIMGLPPRGIFTVVIDDRVVSTFAADDRGSVDMELQEGESASR